MSYLYTAFLHIGKGNVDLFLATTMLYVHNAESKGKARRGREAPCQSWCQPLCQSLLDWPNSNT